MLLLRFGSSSGSGLDCGESSTIRRNVDTTSSMEPPSAVHCLEAECCDKKQSISGSALLCVCTGMYDSIKT